MLYSTVLLDALQTVAEAQSRLQMIPDDAVVVVRRQSGGEVFWYVLTPEEIRSLLAEPTPSMFLEDALELHEYQSVDAIHTSDMSAMDTTASNRTVILENNRILGAVMQGDAIPAELSRSADKAVFPPPPEYSTSHTRGLTMRRMVTRSIATHPGTVRSFKAEPQITGPNRVALNQELELIIGLRKPGAGTVQPGIVIEIPSELKMFSLDIEVSASGFKAPGGFAYQLKVEANDPACHVLPIKLIPASPPESVKRRAVLLGGDALWQAQVNIVYLYNGNPVGFAAHRVLVSIGAGEAESQGSGKPNNWLAGVPSPCAAQVVTGMPQPDLTIIITKPNGNAADGLFQASLRSPHLPLPSGLSFDIDLGLDPSGFAASLMTQIPQQDGQALIESTIEGVGVRVAGVVKDTSFWGLVQSVLSTAYAKRGDPPTVLLLTAEPYVPWELADIGGTILPGTTHPLLAVQARVGRWILGDGNCIPMPGDLKLNIDSMAIVVGEYKPESSLPRLPSAEDEGDFLTDNFPSTRCVQADAFSVSRLLDGKLSEPVQLIHFACHGDTSGATNNLYMNDGHPVPDLVIERSIAGARDHPFVFLNACRVGVGQKQLNQYGGFAGAFLRAQYSGFVGPLWAVNDVVAKNIAIEFYKRIASGDPPSEILRSVRERFEATDSDPIPPSTYVAYVYYGHPDMTMTGLNYTGGG